jgi:hypothetical protein
VGGGVVGAGAAGCSVVDGAGAGAAFSFSGAAGAGAGAGFFSGAVGVVGFFGVGVGVCFLQPLNVNATKARTASAVRTTFLMVNPFRKTISRTLRRNASVLRPWMRL